MYEFGIDYEAARAFAAGDILTPPLSGFSRDPVLDNIYRLRAAAMAADGETDTGDAAPTSTAGSEAGTGVATAPAAPTSTAGSEAGAGVVTAPRNVISISIWEYTVYGFGNKGFHICSG